VPCSEGTTSRLLLLTEGGAPSVDGLVEDRDAVKHQTDDDEHQETDEDHPWCLRERIPETLGAVEDDEVEQNTDEDHLTDPGRPLLRLHDAQDEREYADSDDDQEGDVLRRTEELGDGVLVPCDDPSGHTGDDRDENQPEALASGVDSRVDGLGGRGGSCGCGHCFYSKDCGLNARL